MPEPYEFSAALSTIWKEIVNDPVLKDPRSSYALNTKFGYEFNFVCENILQKGRCNFGTDYNGSNGPLSSGEKVLLYAFANAKRHFFACRKVFDHYDGLAAVVKSEHPIIVDLGCGPATAGLAAAESFPGSSFDYIGIDCADAMLRLGARLMQEVMARELTGANCTVSWDRDWSSTRIEPTRNVILICSYLCASDAINVRSICDLVERLRRSRRTAELWLLYLNSTNPMAGGNYRRLLNLLNLQREPDALTTTFVAGSGPTEEIFHADAVKWCRT